MNGKMDVSKVTDNLWLIFLVAVALTGLCLALDKLQGGLISRMRLRNGRLSTPGTSQPTSPEKQKTNLPATYQNVLPPQRRKALPLPDISSEEILQHILPMSMDYTICQETKIYTPTGFSIQEIRDLGDFPDYTKLSGVPMPQAYTEFNIDTALPRPYRPFRWPYHQTMGMSLTPEQSNDQDLTKDEKQSPKWNRTGGSSSKTRTKHALPNVKISTPNTQQASSPTSPAPS